MERYTIEAAVGRLIEQGASFATIEDLTIYIKNVDQGRIVQGLS